MKGKKKYILPLVLAGMTATSGVVANFNEQSIVRAEEVAPETSLAGETIELKGGFDDIYQLGSSVTMPEVTGVTDYKFVIKRGSKVVKEIDAADSDKTFTPSYTGSYSVEVQSTADNKVVTVLDGLNIVVEKPDAVINLPINSEYVIPAQIGQGQEGLKIPAPTVTLTTSDGEEETKEASDLDGALKVILVTPSEDVELDLSDDAYYEVDKDDLEDLGTYQIRYEYRSNTDILVSKLETNFQVVKADTLTATKLYMKLSSSVPSTGNVNTDVTVPKVTVLTSTTATDGVNAHITVTAKLLDDENAEPIEINYEDYTFKPTKVGTYILTYKADVDVLGLHADAYIPATTIKVTDNKAPTVMATYAYDVADGAVTAYGTSNEDVVGLEVGDELADVMQNRRADVPSAVKLVNGSAKFTLPAIWGEDNLDGWGDLTFTREVVGNSITKKTVTAEANKVSEEIELKATGSYEIRYIVTDKAGKTTRATYPLVVYSADDFDEENGETKIELSVGVSTITDKEVLKFSAPKVSDTYDDELDVEVGYYVLYGDAVINSQKLTETNDEGKYEINIAKLLETNATADGVQIYCKATADATLLDTRDAFVGTTTTEKTSKIVKIKKITDDLSCATFSIADINAWNSALINANKGDGAEDEGILVTNGSDAKADEIDEYGYAKVSSTYITVGDVVDGVKLAAFDQGKSVLKLPVVKFTDNDENLKIRVTIKDRFGNIVTKDSAEKIDKELVGSTYEYSISDASFRLSSSGVYTVTYRAEDTRGNVTVQSYGIRVNDRTAPTIVIDDEDKFGKDIEIGEWFDVPQGRLIKNGETLPDNEVTWYVSSTAQYETRSTGFRPLSEGTFYIRYAGMDDLENVQILEEDSLFYVNAKDTKAPVFNDDSTYTLKPTMEWNPTDGEMIVKIPRVEATDPNSNNPIDVVYTITSPDGTKATVKDFEITDTDNYAEDVRYFVAKAQGNYTIKYEATDESNNTVTMTKTVAIGDCEKPTITWANEELNIKKTVKLGDTLEIVLGNLTASDNVTDEDKLLENLTIKLVKPDGATVVTDEGRENVDCKWKLDETGTYTLNVTLKDEAGNTNTYKYNIEVPDEDADSKTENHTGWGIAAICGAVVILAGVVIYFVVSSKKKSPKSTKKSK